MKVGFLLNQVDNRGTGNAVFDYARYNQEILGNESFIFTASWQNSDHGMASRMLNEFGIIRSLWDAGDVPLDAFYHIKSGENNDFLIQDIPYLVHAVFNASQPHGTRYATISEWMGERYGVPYVPHIIDLAEPNSGLREKLGIPRGSIVYGRHGGLDTFDISWAWNSINNALQKSSEIYFIFMNTARPSVDLYDPSRVFFLEGTADPYKKSAFIYSCDAMLHARGRGETFGISVGEFAVAGKPVVTYGLSEERAHIKQLGSSAITYESQAELTDILLNFDPNQLDYHTAYDYYTPVNVMAKFREVFLDNLKAE